ncbi:MAG: hypothetical protein IKM00_04045, partial [Clostridia bacterium]|nr:hypothetical protein [Clostridia bacterium]
MNPILQNMTPTRIGDAVLPEARIAQKAPIGAEQLQELTAILQNYKAGKAITEQRIIASENWWKLRNASEEHSKTDLLKKGFVSKSGWLHNVIVSKHADAIEAYPEPNILPREEGDRSEARMLSSIIPCVLEQNKFEKTYDDAMWRKMKSGTAVYKVVWDKNKLNGLGDISVECVNILNLFWEPGVTDIQKSRYFFHTELCDKDVLRERYPELLRDGVKNVGFISSKFLYDDSVDTENKATVIECYYHKWMQGKNTLQYVKYVGDVVLYATENEAAPIADGMGQPKPPMAITGLYDHGRYPYVFDALFPIEGSPCGYGYVDICRNPQTEIDMLKTCFIRNARVGSIPRYFSRGDGTVNEEEFLDLDNPIVHAAGGIDANVLRPIDHKPIDGSYLNLLQWDVNELRETSGNTETSSGNTSSGVTAASAIAALQEASGKGSRDSTRASYRAYTTIVEFCIELIRQFYNMPRKFRILGQHGSEQYISYTNRGIQPQHQGVDFGQDMGMRLPTFDVKVSAQKKNAYTKVTQNELAIQFFKMGFFNPQMTDQALMCLDLMEFDGKDGLMQKIAQNGTI